jgi:maltose alpha-D-glucosyltransferase / alpha-amylase
MDAVPFVIGTKGADVKRPREQYDMLRAFREFLQWRVGDSIILAEANIVPKVAMQYFGDDGHRIQMMFNFHVNQHLFHALATTDTRPLVAAMRNTGQRPASGQWGTFLRNHDELDLGRLSERQRRAVFDAFGPNPEHQLYRRGIRRRLAPMLGGDRRRLELANSLMFTLPGTPVLRYGDELAMGDDLSLPERACGRTPMQWSTEPNGGFTKSKKPVIPVVSEGPYSFQHVNAAQQRRDPDSMLNWTERIIRMRKELPEIGWGEVEILDTGDDAVLGVRYDWRNNSALFLHNFAGDPHEIEFSAGLKDAAGNVLVNVLSADHSHVQKNGKHIVSLEGYGYRWYRVGGLDDLLKRTNF